MTLAQILLTEIMDDNFKYIALLGDSIFDNDAYVLNGPGVIAQLRVSMPSHWSAIKLAIDGDCIRHVESRLNYLPNHMTDLVLSIGGNDAMGYSHLLADAKSLADIPKIVRAPVAKFRVNYRRLLNYLQSFEMKLHICTIYTAIPFPDPMWRQAVPIALGHFNDVIMEEARKRHLGLIKLNEVCTEPEDFSIKSPIEPSAIGGQKIVNAIIRRCGQTIIADLDVLGGKGTDKIEIVDAGLEDIIALFYRLDSKSHSLLMLETSRESLLVGGGRENFVVIKTIGNNNYTLRNDQPSVAQMISIVVGGQRGEYSANIVVDSDTALMAIKSFCLGYDTGDNWILD